MEINSFLPRNEARQGVLTCADMKKYVAEFVGTLALVFAGSGAIVIDEVSNGAVTHVGIAFTFGLVVMAMIYAVGDVSGAHLWRWEQSSPWKPHSQDQYLELQ